MLECFVGSGLSKVNCMKGDVFNVYTVSIFSGHEL